MAKNSSRPKQKQRAARKIKKAAKTRKPFPTPQQRFPELAALPFVKYLDAKPGDQQCDWWAVPEAIRALDWLDQEFVGAEYFIRTLDHMTKRATVDGNPCQLFTNIIDGMASKGSIICRLREERDAVAMGFVAAVAEHALSMRQFLVAFVARSKGRYEHHLEQHKGRRIDKGTRKSLEATVAARAAYLDGAADKLGVR